jgi:hypothetical protein
VAASYPLWKYYPPRERPPTWVADVVAAFHRVGDAIDSRTISGTTSDAALAILRPGLVALGFDVEAGKKKAEKIRRPVLFGEQGSEDLAYEVDAFHMDLWIALEVEAGRGARGNAVYRDLIQTSLLVDAKYLVLAVAQEYRHKLTANEAGAVVQSYRDARRILDAIYASARLQLPLDGILLVGY